MTFLGLLIGRLHPTMRASLETAALTYDFVGTTLDPSAVTGRPTPYERTIQLGVGPDAFERGRHALRTWVPQHGVGATISPPDAHPDLGTTVVVALGVGPLRLNVPVRVVAVIDEPRQFAYAYGTLPGHPESGEEAFIVRHHDDDTVTLTIRVDADPIPALRRLNRLMLPMQHLALRRYLTATAAAVSGDPGPQEP